MKVEEQETNLMSLVIKFYFTSSTLNMFRTLIHPSSGACDFSIVSTHWSCVLVSLCVGVSMWLRWSGIRVAGWSFSFSLLHGYHSNAATSKLQHTLKQEHKKLQLQPATRIPLQRSHIETPTHIETRTRDQCVDIIEKSQAPDDGCINVRNMLNIEEVK